MINFGIAIVYLAITSFVCVWLVTDSKTDIGNGFLAVCLSVLGSALAICSVLTTR